jgi:pimeloyl-ACP methyl ester carboxylesterase
LIWFGLGIVLIALATLPFLFEMQRRKLEEATRANLQGPFATLSAGVTHFRWHGPPNGPVIVAIHGLTMPAIVWDGMIPLLTAQGFRVLSYDLFGRGLSDAPHGMQDTAFFVDQLDDLIASQDISSDVILMGYGMGGSIAVVYSATYPEGVSRVLLVAPAGMNMSMSVFDRICCAVPIFGDWMHAAFAAGRMRRRAISSLRSSDIEKMETFQLSRRGYLPAVLASQKGILAQSQTAAHRTLGRNGIPVFAVWGQGDDIVPLSAMGVLTIWNRNVIHAEIKGAGHGLPYTHPQETVAAFTDMMGTKS